MDHTYTDIKNRQTSYHIAAGKRTKALTKSITILLPDEYASSIRQAL